MSREPADRPATASDPGAQPLRVVMDARVLGAGIAEAHARTGIFRMAERLARGLLERDEVDLRFTSTGHLDHVHAAREFVAGRLDSDARFEGEGLMRYARGISSASFSNALRRVPLAGKTWRLLQPGLRMLRDRPAPADVYFSPYSALPPIRRTRARARVLVLNDVIPVLHPEFFVRRSVGAFRKILASIEPSDWVVAISETSRRDFLAAQPHDPGRVAVMPLAAEPAFGAPTARERVAAVRARYALGAEPYVLCVCTREPRKNLPHLVRCFAAAADSLGDLRLVLAGPSGWLEERLRDELGASPVRARISLPGFVDEEDLPALYAGARIFAFPSHYEGFGLPVLEAMQSGVPVVTSTAGALPELVGEAGLQVDPDDAPALCEALVRLATEAPLRDRLAAAGLARAAAHRWSASVDALEAVFQRAVREAR